MKLQEFFTFDVTTPLIMKTIFQLIFLFVLIACSSSENKNAGDGDSTAIAESVNESSDVGDIVEEELTGHDSLTLDQRFTAWKEMIDSNTDSLLEVSISTQQYEASSTVTWYFNSEIEPVYFSISWSSEGNEGSTEYVIKNKEVMCAWIENNSMEEKWCSSTEGLRTMPDGEETKEPLGDAFGNEQTQNLQSELQKLSVFFKSAGEVEEDGDWITFRLENVVNYGAEFTEYTETKVHKRVFEELK